MPVLEVRHVSKNFGAIQALTDVSFQVERGEVVGLMGDNGAGKSTIVKTVAGNFPPNTNISAWGAPPHSLTRPETSAMAMADDPARAHDSVSRMLVRNRSRIPDSYRR